MTMLILRLLQQQQQRQLEHRLNFRDNPVDRLQLFTRITIKKRLFQQYSTEFLSKQLVCKYAAVWPQGPKSHVRGA